MERIYTVNKAGVDDMLASQKDFGSSSFISLSLQRVRKESLSPWLEQLTSLTT
jgi:hypothetical protein